jgi:hypothetical protein
MHGPSSRFTAEQLERARQGAEEARDWAVHAVEDRPLAALCAVFGAGLVLGISGVTAYCAAQQRAQARQHHDLIERMTQAVARALPQQLRDVLHR